MAGDWFETLLPFSWSEGARMVQNVNKGKFPFTREDWNRIHYGFQVGKLISQWENGKLFNNGNSSTKARNRFWVNDRNKYYKIDIRNRQRSIESGLYSKSFKRKSRFYRYRHYASNRRMSRRRRY